MTEYFIGIDSGTQSTKAVVLDIKEKKIIQQASSPHDIIEDVYGKKEQHPQWWIDACDKVLFEVLSKIDKSKVKGIGVSAQQHGFVALDKNGYPIRPAKLWNDTTTSKECKYLIKKLGGLKRVISLTGNSIPAGFTVSKILWFKRNEPDNYKKLHIVLLPHNYINYYLTGELKIEYGDTSGTGMFDVRKRIWVKEILDIIDPELINKLPPFQKPYEICGYIKKEISEKFGLNKDVIVSAGGGDNMMSAIGTGNVEEGVVTLSLGTSGTIFAYSSKPVYDKQKGEIAAFCDSTGGWLPLVCTMNVTVATELIRKTFDMSIEEMNILIENTPPGSSGLVLIPYLSGERTPDIPDGTGVFFGVNTITFDKKYLCRSAMEGVTLGLKYGFEKLKKLGIKPKQIRLTGGGAKSKVWRQIVSDVFNCEVVCMEVEESAAFGAALQAYWAYLNLRGKISIKEITDEFCKVKIDTTTQPKKSNVIKYEYLYDLQQKITNKIMSVFGFHKKILKKLESI
ncbi:MAG: xylulokinase [Endomicrobiia bacterium]